MKKIKNRPLLVAMVLLFGQNVVGAQVPKNMSLSQAIDLAISSSSQLKVDSVNYQIAESRWQQTKQANLPQVNLNASYIRISDNITPFKVGFPTGEVVLNPQILNQSYNALQVRQLIFSGGKVKQAEKINFLEKNLATLQQKKSKNEIAVAVTNIWFSLFTINQNRAIVQANLLQLQKQRIDVQNFVQQGIALENDLLKIDLAITNLQVSLSEIESIKKTLQFNLGTFTGVAEWEQLDVEPVVPTVQVPFENLDVALETAYNNRPELAMFKLRKAQTDAANTIIKGNIWPTISTGGSYNYDLPNQRLFPNQAVFTGTWNVGVFFNWNLTDLYTNKEKKSEGNFNQQKISFAVDAAKKGISMEISEKYNQWTQAKQQVKSYKVAVQQAEENYRVEKNRYQQNIVTTTDFLNANTQLLQSKINLVAGDANVALAYQNLLHSIYIKN
ncbi:MAG: TolC family protein [Bacteroidetes bacterium]|nr:MAG: TolC family protein [Bacteroidota bacterium]